jgi:hypothetical protein
LQPKNEDIRSGLLFALSEWAAKTINRLPESKKHVWKPSILFPTITSHNLLSSYPLIRSILFPNGTLSVLGLELSKKNEKSKLESLPDIVGKFGEEGIFTNYSQIKTKDYLEGVSVSLQAIEGQFFHPNILFLPIAKKLSEAATRKICEITYDTDAGIIFFERDEDIGLGTEEDIHVWIPPDSMDGDFYEDRPFDLAMLIAYRLHRNWAGKITLWMCVDKKEKEEEAKSYLRKLVYEARFPPGTKTEVFTKGFSKALRDSPDGDIHIISFQNPKKLAKFIRKTKKPKLTYLYVVDSGHEDVLA